MFTTRILSPVTLAIAVAAAVVLAPSLAGLDGVAYAQRHAIPDGLPPMMLLDRLPEGAIEIAEAMTAATKGERIVIRGRVTDGVDVFVDNRAIIRLADEAAMPACCAPGALATNTACTVPANRRATVQFLDTRGRLIRLGLRGRYGLTVGKEVFIVGTVREADHDRTLIIDAAGLHVPAGDVPVGLMVDRAPVGAVDVAAARDTARVGERIVVRGRVGGVTKPLEDGAMTVTVVDRAIETCDQIECETPWAACQTTPATLAANSARIVVTGADGQPIRSDLRGRRGLREFSELTVSGEVIAASDGTFVVRATALHVSPAAEGAATPAE